MPIIQTAPPGAYPLDVAEIRHHVRQDDDFDDVLLLAMLDSMGAEAITQIRASIVSAGWRLLLDGFDTEISLPRGPLIGAPLVEYLQMDGITWAPVDPSIYIVSTGLHPTLSLAFGRVWPIPRPQAGCVRISYLGGFAAALVPDLGANAVRLINWAPLTEGDALYFSNSGGALPAPLQPRRAYYVQALAPGGGYILTDTPGGAPITLADAGTGTHYGGAPVCAQPPGEVPHGLRAWIAAHVDTLYRNRGSTLANAQINPWLDSLLNAFRSVP